jgi:uncharacterized protein (DUF2252 family)
VTTRTVSTARRAPVPRRVEHLTVDERAARGRTARAEVPRSAHAEFDPGADRPDPIALLQQQATSRVPELVPIRYGRMMVSPFTFYRGAALVMASDLSRTPTTSVRAQLCGDAHLSNFGVFGTAERRLVLDINDFDETLPGPFEWDVKRLAVSFEVAGRDRAFSAADRQAVLLELMETYRTAMAEFSAASNLDVFYASMDVEDIITRYRSSVSEKVLRRTEKNVEKARTRDRMQAFEKLTTVVDGEPRIVSSPPLVVSVSDLYPDEQADRIAEWAHEALRAYRATLSTDRRKLLERYQFVDLARKVVGVGSVGTRAWIALFTGRDRGDPLFLQLKEAQPSVLEAFAGKSEYRNPGHRVVAGQRLMQAAGDIFLGYLWVTNPMENKTRAFYVRQLRDWKGSADVDAMVPEGMRVYARLCGWTLARAHARSGDAIAMSAYIGKGGAFDKAIAAFSVKYADQNERDHQALLEAVKSGRVVAETGV